MAPPPPAGGPTSSHMQVPPLPKPPGQDPLSSIKNNNNNNNNNKQDAATGVPRPVRRVSFSEIPAKPYDHRRSHSGNRSKKRGGCSSCCICYMWTCIILLCFLFALALVGALFFGYFQPQLPEFRIERINFPGFEVKTSPSDQQDYLSTDLDLYVVATNINRKIEFLFSPLVVYVSSGYVSLGKGEVPGFSLGLHNTTVLKVVQSMGVKDSLVDNQNGARLRKEFNGRTTLNVDVFMSGTVKVFFGRPAELNFPITVICKDVNVYQVGLGIEPACNVELFSFQIVSETNLF